MALPACRVYVARARRALMRLARHHSHVNQPGRGYRVVHEMQSPISRAEARMPERYPQVDAATLEQWRNLPYADLAFEILSAS